MRSPFITPQISEASAWNHLHPKHETISPPHGGSRGVAGLCERGNAGEGREMGQPRVKVREQAMGQHRVKVGEWSVGQPRVKVKEQATDQPKVKVREWAMGQPRVSFSSSSWLCDHKHFADPS